MIHCLKRCLSARDMVSEWLSTCLTSLVIPISMGSLDAQSGRMITFIAVTSLIVLTPIKRSTILHLIELDDNQLTYLHDGRYGQLSQTGGDVIHELIA